MKIRDHLSDEQLAKLKRKARKKEKLSQSDLRDLMGVNRDTYKKVNGKWRSK